MTISHNSEGCFDHLNNSNRPKRNFILRSFSIETNKGILLILASVTLFLAVFGGAYIKWAQSSNPPEFRLSRTSSQPSPTLQTVQTDAIEAITISAGILNDFYVLTKDKILYYHLLDSPRGELQIRKRFEIELDKRPTASCFVMRPDSYFHEKLFIAFANSISLFDPESMTLSHYIQFEPESNITGLATDGYDLYAADSGLGIFYRIDRGNAVSSWGIPDEKTGFQGFSKNRYSFFDLDISQKNETIYVTHPDKYRIEAFSALDGHWKKEESFEKSPTDDNDQGETFTGVSNPASIIILGDGSFLTTDSGPEPGVKSWHPDGSFQAEILLPEINTPIAADQAPLVTVTFTESRRGRLLILMPTGMLVSLMASP